MRNWKWRRMKKEESQKQKPQQKRKIGNFTSWRSFLYIQAGASHLYFTTSIQFTDPWIPKPVIGPISVGPLRATFGGFRSLTIRVQGSVHDTTISPLPWIGSFIINSLQV